MLVALGLLAPGTRAHAQQPQPQPQALPRREVKFAWDKSLLRVSMGVRDVIDADMSKKFASGLPNVIAVRAYLLREGEDAPVALAVRTCRVVYDLWDEVYRLRVSGIGEDRNVAVLSTEGVFRQCADLKDLAIADKALLAPGKVHFLGVIVEVNPVSPQMLEQMRRWVSRPAGSTGIGPGDALFGSFVGLFVRQIGTSDRTLRFRSQPVPAPPPPAP
jgi:hypothetical protein